MYVELQVRDAIENCAARGKLACCVTNSAGTKKFWPAPPRRFCDFDRVIARLSYVRIPARLAAHTQTRPLIWEKNEKQTDAVK